MRVGLGSGRAAEAFVRALAAERRLEVLGVPTSRATAALATSLGLVVSDRLVDPIDITVDGADEVDPRLDLIKGYGGALTRERIVAAASRRQVILVTAGEARAPPGHAGSAARGDHAVRGAPLSAAAPRPRLRSPPSRDGRGALRHRQRQLDPRLRDRAQDDAAALDRDIRRIPGVVDTGFFLGTAEQVLVAEAEAVRVLRRAGDPGGA